MTAMTSRDRRALIGGATIAVAAVLGLRTGPWVWRQSHETLARLRGEAALVARQRAEVGHLKELEDSATVVRRRLLALAPKLLAGGTASEATAVLASQLAVVAERSRVRLNRTDASLDSMAGPGLKRITVRTAIEGDTRGTLGFLDALATAPLVLVVDELRGVAPDPGSGGATPEILRTELTVHGWYLDQGARR